MENLRKTAMLLSFFKFVSLIVPYAAFSISGDILYVQVDVANLRQGDSLKQPVVSWLKKGNKVIEIQRKGEWVEVVVDWTEGQTGWIHSSIIDRNVIADKSQSPKNDKFSKFKMAFDKFNQNALAIHGRKPFIELIDMKYGVVQIVASDFWLNEQTDIIELYSLLDKTGISDFPIAIHIVDQDGNRHLSMIR